MTYVFTLDGRALFCSTCYRNKASLQGKEED